MLGDTRDLQRRLRSLLPARWFADEAPILDSVLQGLGTPWSWIFQFIQYAAQQVRLSTSSGQWLDLIGLDFFGRSVRRLSDEPDEHYRSRIRYLLFRPAGTRGAVSSAIEHLTGKQPWIFEPANTADTGSYGGRGSFAHSGLAYGCCGGWGNLSLPYQTFLIIGRARPSGLANLPGYASNEAGYGASSTSYASAGLRLGGAEDADVLDSLKRLMPIGATAWVRFE